jgi:vacuolar protein sorting-associated protein 13A/C
LVKVYLLAVPGTDVPYDRIEEERLAQEVKMAAVESMLAAQDAAATAEAESAAGTVFRVVNNVQVEISRIHVRFEDTGRTSGAKPFSCGLTLGEVSARSATESGALVDLRAWPAGLDDAIARKQLMLRGLSVFWTPSDHGFLTPVLARGTDRIHAAMQSVTPTDSSRIEHTQYVVHPISASGQFTINKKTQPQHELELEFDGIAVSLSADQYRSVLGAADYFAWLTVRPFLDVQLRRSLSLSLSLPCGRSYVVTE